MEKESQIWVTKNVSDSASAAIEVPNYLSSAQGASAPASNGVVAVGTATRCRQSLSEFVTKKVNTSI
jgi:hypothetical protein